MDSSTIGDLKADRVASGTRRICRLETGVQLYIGTADLVPDSALSDIRTNMRTTAMDRVVRDLLSRECEKSGQKMDTGKTQRPRVRTAGAPSATLSN